MSGASCTLVPLRRVARIVNGGTPGPAERFWGGNIPWATPVDLNKVDGGWLTATDRTITDDGLADGSTLIPAQSVVISSRAPIGYIANSAVPIAFNQGCKGIVPITHNTNARFLLYALQSQIDYLKTLGQGSTFLEVGTSQVASLKIPWTNPATQFRIADYLDHETAEIDQFITGLKSLQDLSTERTEARMIQTIQTGEWSADDLIGTGIPEWPQAPTSWRHARLKSTIRDVRNGAWGEDPETDGEIRRCIRVADFSKASASIHNNAVTSRSYTQPQARYLSLETGDLIIEKSGGGPTTPVGNVVLYSGPGGDMYSNFVARIRLADGIDKTYAVWLHRSLYLNQVTHRSIKQTTGIQNLDADSYFNESIFVPPHEEQHRIGSSVAKMVALQDELRTEIRKSITLARERRAALITAAVTGQIDVTARHKPVAEQLEDDIAQGLHREN